MFDQKHEFIELFAHDDIDENSMEGIREGAINQKHINGV